MTDPSAAAGSTRWAWLRGHGGMFVGFAAVHAALVLNSIPLRVVFGAKPFGGPDYQTHFQHTHTLTRALAEGRLWVYDPMMLAGYPAGLFFDVDNKAHFLFCTVLHRLGVPLATAFNLFTLVSAIAMPISLWLAARLLGVPAKAQAWSFGLGVLLWHFESLIRFFWGGGMISFATVSHLCVLVLALFWRQLAGSPVRGGWAALLMLLPLALLTHVWSFAALAGPMIGLYLARARVLRLVDHVRVWALAALTVAINAYWLWPALTHMELMAPSHKLGQATPDFFFYDLLEVFVDPLTTGFVRQRTLVRTVAVLAAIGTLVAWRRARAPALRYAGGTLVWLFGLSYVGALLPLVPVTEPYRFAAPMACWAAVLAGPWLADNLTRKTWSQVPASLRGLALGLLVLLAPRVYAQLATFLPGVDVSPMGFCRAPCSRSSSSRACACGRSATTSRRSPRGSRPSPTTAASSCITGRSASTCAGPPIDRSSAVSPIGARSTSRPTCSTGPTATSATTKASSATCRPSTSPTCSCRCRTSRPSSAGSTCWSRAGSSADAIAPTACAGRRATSWAAAPR
ncbi:hypothetical protein [Nannocystis pusilla]|uniref:hypothetical protein n=1 Tax=Nannocystis pusilla TaxID=889268 RepID=UPI003B768641